MICERNYFRCENCKLIFVPPEQRISRDEEFSRYELHENDPSDPRYRKFLSKISGPMLDRIEPGSFGLDFGSGPGPTLSVMFEEQGHIVNLFDSFYDNNPRVFDHTYDFITATEVIEHLFNPLFELDRLWDCLKPGGWLGIMTKLATDKNAFENWHYKNDDTHIAFYSKETFLWIAERWHASLDFEGPDVIIIQKNT
ncbi:MAG: class I SAM-dependent methyltransferase [Balneolaceae bacterium]